MFVDIWVFLGKQQQEKQKKEETGRKKERKQQKKEIMKRQTENQRMKGKSNKGKETLENQFVLFLFIFVCY